MLTVSKKYRNNKETQQPARNAQMLVNFLPTFQREVGGEGWGGGQLHTCSPGSANQRWPRNSK